MHQDFPTVYDFSADLLDGRPVSLSEFRGQVLLIVNTASKCGFTPQYAGLEALYRTCRDRGFAVLGFPSNQFGAQEPGSDAEIGAFCESRYGVSFPMFAKIAVTGPEIHPLYSALIAAEPTATGATRAAFREKLNGFLGKNGFPPTNPEPGILWNFEKFLVGRDGKVAARFSPEVVPDDPAILAAIEAALAA